MILAPFAAAIWALCIAAVRERPELLNARLPWCSIRGDQVDLFYLADQNCPVVREHLASFEDALTRVTATLNFEPLTFKIAIFLFPDVESLNKEAGSPSAASPSIGFAQRDTICMSLPMDDHSRVTVAHELTHVLLFQHIGADPPALLNEGLACYLQNKLYDYDRPGEPSSVPWSLMARQTVFHHWRFSEEPEMDSDDTYSYALSVADFLINVYGLDRYLDLCRKSVTDKEHLAGDVFVKAIEEVYGRPVDDLEREWRAGCAPSESEKSTLRAVAGLEARMQVLEDINRDLQIRLVGQGVFDFPTTPPACVEH